MSPSSPSSTNNTDTNNNNSRKLSNPSPTRNQLVERCSSLRGCEPCKRRKRICNGQKPCTHCLAESQECVYSVVSDHARSVFTTSTARRLSSGSACETCRRRKTKCDGASPCGFCASSGIECINNSERRKRSIVAAHNNNNNLPLTSSSLANNASTIEDGTTQAGDNEAIDRIEDRLRRIEKLMTAFSPSPLSQHQQQFSKEIKDIKRVTAGFRKMSSPHLQKPSPMSSVRRQHRHSIQGPTSSSTSGSSSSSSVSSITSSSEKNEFKDRNHIPYASPPNSNGSIKSFHDTINYAQPPKQQQQQQQQRSQQSQQQQMASPSPPLSPRLPRQNSSTTNMVASSMLNLSLSPSSSSTTTSSSSLYNNNLVTYSSSPTPTSPLAQNNTNNSSSPSLHHQHGEWKQSTPIPSLMDQLSKVTFVTTAMDYTTVHYPIYPITTTPPPPSASNLQQPNETTS